MADLFLQYCLNLGLFYVKIKEKVKGVFKMKKLITNVNFAIIAGIFPKARVHRIRGRFEVIQKGVGFLTPNNIAIGVG